MKIVDCHGHIFPRLAEACGFASVELHLLHQQRGMHTHGNQPVRRLRDDAIVQDRPLWSADDPSEDGRATDVDFRVGRHGRFEWRHGGVDYYVQFLPPCLRETSMPADALIAEMDYAGIGTLVLQNDHLYGNLSTFFAAAIRQYPGRFIGLAQVEEAFAHEDEQITALVRQVRDDGMRGLYFTLAGFFRNGYREYYTAPAYRPFWDTVSDLGLPVFWVFLTNSPIGDFNAEMSHFAEWRSRYPNIPSVFVHGLPTGLFADDEDRLTFPSYVNELMTHGPTFTEVLYPITWGGRMPYPYARAQNHIRQLYDQYGADRLIWGSDMPNVARYCTYRQSLSYVLDDCDFIADADRDKIFASNTLSLFGE